MIARALVCCVALLAAAHAIDNGKGRTPPMGWRSWNLFGFSVDQQLMEAQMRGLVSRTRLVDGVPTSLADLGYTDAGLDDAWQQCGAYGPQKYTYHGADGTPQVDTQKFPDLRAMTDYAHRLGLTVGWYGNNCKCQDHCTDAACYARDVAATIAYGFDGIKLDNCGAQLDLALWSSLYNQSGKAIMIENCHWGQTLPTADSCPFNFYRTSNDVRASYLSTVLTLMSTVPLAQQGLSRPGCWAFPDMLEIGCYNGTTCSGDWSEPGLTLTESRTHFGAWCIVSSPLILGYDLQNTTIGDSVWPFVSNREAIAVNQAWAGESGAPFAASGILEPYVCMYTHSACWQMWSKRVDASTGATAVLVINHSQAPLAAGAIAVAFAKVPSLAHLPLTTRFRVRNVWTRADVGVFADAVPVDALPSRDSAFLLVTPLLE